MSKSTALHLHLSAFLWGRVVAAVLVFLIPLPKDTIVLQEVAGAGFEVRTYDPSTLGGRGRGIPLNSSPT